jgi:hypothetical protein
MSIRELAESESIEDLRVVVKTRYAYNESSNGILPAGPRDEHARHIGVLVATDVTKQNYKRNIFIFLYDIWAEKCAFIKVHSELIITASKNIFFMNNQNGKNEYCLCFAEANVLGEEATIQVRLE